MSVWARLESRTPQPLPWEVRLSSRAHSLWIDICWHFEFVDNLFFSLSAYFPLAFRINLQ
jgi:hypothetical protein